MHHVHDEVAYRDHPIERRGCVIRELDGKFAALPRLLAAAASHCCLWSAVESHLATAYSKRSIALAENLADVHSEIDVELGAEPPPESFAAAGQLHGAVGAVEQAVGRD